MNGALRLIEQDAFPLGRLEPRSVALQLQETNYVRA